VIQIKANPTGLSRPQEDLWRLATGDPPRVAVVLTQLGLGGAERQTVELLRRLKGTAWEPVVVICLSNSVEPYAHHVRELGYPLEIVRRRASFDIGRLVWLRRLFRSYEIHLVHSVHLLAAAYCWIACWREPNRAVLPTFRGGNVNHGPVRRYFYKRIIAESSFTLVNSNRGAHVLVSDLNAQPERLVVIPNGVDFQELRERASTPSLRTDLGIAASDPIVGFVGSNRQVKNLPRFVALADRLVQKIPSLRIVVVGPGLDESARTRLAPTLAASRTHFLGPRSDVPSLLADMDVLVITSDSEGCPNVALEALGLGVPVVGANVGDIPQLIATAEIGTVVPADDLDEYLRQVIRYLNIHRDSKTVHRQPSPRFEREYGMEAMIGRTLKLWQHLVVEPRAKTCVE
jgi:glycosyltransferase involved in cell wall biosynthesis